MTGTIANTISGRRRWLLVGLVAVFTALACSASATSTPLPQAPQVSVIVVTTDNSVGDNRVVFGLVDSEGMPLRSDEVPVRTVFIDPQENADAVEDSAIAKFVRWPSGFQGVFTTSLEFNVPGIWELQVDTTTSEGKAVTARGALQVNEESLTPGIGNPPPSSITPTGDSVENLATITSSPDPDPDLYQLSVHEALRAGKPLVVVFATPAFCVTATCGPQVSVISQLKEQYSGRANFIHVEVVKDPHLIEGGRHSSAFVEAVTDWGLPTEPWTFIIDEGGLVHAKFESFAALEELANSLQKLLGS